jgi:hypothetical protein
MLKVFLFNLCVEYCMGGFGWVGEGYDKFKLYFSVTSVCIEVCLVIISCHLRASIE